MEFIAFWLGTVTASYIMQFISAFRIIKNMADDGFKFDKERIKELNKLINDENQTLFRRLIMLIPVLNVGYSYYMTFVEEASKERLKSAFVTMGMAREMDEIEIFLYNQKPTALRAIGIELSKDVFLASNYTIRIDSPLGESLIVYSETEEGRDVKFVSGPIRTMTKEEKDALIDEISKYETIRLGVKIKSEYGSLAKYLENVSEKSLNELLDFYKDKQKVYKLHDEKRLELVKMDLNEAIELLSKEELLALRQQVIQEERETEKDKYTLSLNKNEKNS